MDSERDHVQWLARYPLPVPVSARVNRAKGASRRKRRKERPAIANRFHDNGVLWSPSYVASTGEGMVLMTNKRRIGRPRSFEEEAALTAAMQLFWERGYAATSIQNLAAVMGLNPPSIYNVFGDKERLFLRCLDRYEQAIDQIGYSGLEASASPREAVASLLDRIIAVALGESNPAGCMLMTALPASVLSHPDFRQRLAQAIADLDRRHRQLLQGANGDLNAEQLAPLITAAIQSIALRARSGAPRAELEALKQTILRLIPEAIAQ